MPKSRKSRKYFEPKKKKVESEAPVATAPMPGGAPLPAKASTAAPKVKSLAVRYPYVGTELKRITLLTAAIIVILIILALVLP